MFLADLKLHEYLCSCPATPNSVTKYNSNCGCISFKQVFFEPCHTENSCFGKVFLHEGSS